MPGRRQAIRDAGPVHELLAEHHRPRARPGDDGALPVPQLDDSPGQGVFQSVCKIARIAARDVEDVRVPQGAKYDPVFGIPPGYEV